MSKIVTKLSEITDRHAPIRKVFKTKETRKNRNYTNNSGIYKAQAKKKLVCKRKTCLKTARELP